MSLPTITDDEVNEVINYLRSKGQHVYANRLLGMQEIKRVGSLQYAEGIKAIRAVYEALTTKVPRDRILARILSIIKDMEQYL